MTADLEDLGRKLDEIKAKESAKIAREAKAESDSSNMARGIRAGAELITPMIAGGLIGWGLDQWFGSKPLCLIIFLLLGVMTGFVNVWKMTQNIGSGIGYSELHRRQKDAKRSPSGKNDISEG
jgi:ATP synthase protein I